MGAPIQGRLYETDERRYLRLRLLDLLRREHRGRANAISLKEIGAVFGVPWKTINSWLGELVVLRGYPIGTSIGSAEHPPGAYWIVDEEDRRVALDNLRPRAMAVLRRWQRLARVSAAELAGQIRLELETTRSAETDLHRRGR